MAPRGKKKPSKKKAKSGQNRQSEDDQSQHPPPAPAMLPRRELLVKHYDSEENRNYHATLKILKNQLRKLQEKQKKDGEKSNLKQNHTATAKDKRSNDDLDIKTAQGRLEDFLYYQTPETRWKRLRDIDPETRLDAAAERSQRATPYLLPNDGGKYNEWVHSVLDTYDSLGVGNTDYRQGFTDSIGNRLPASSQSPVAPVVGPMDLHLWTPPPRRQPVGLGRDPVAPWSQTAWDLRLDEAAIETRRLQIETVRHEKDDPDVLTHQDRRQYELEMYDATTAGRPTTANVRIRQEAGQSFTDDHFRKIRTSQGLFIAARESSWDWLTSYDCLGKVKRGEIPEIFPTSNVRNDDDDDDDWILEEEPKHALNDDAPTNANNGKADIDYPYPKNEFSKPPQAPKTFENYLQVGPWAEETTGRREWHHYGMMSPSSEVDSPPHLPIQPGVIRDIPKGFDLDDEAYPPLEPSRQRCTNNPERCRVWWNPDHPAEECWIAFSEQPSRPKDPIQWPILDNNEPKDQEDDYVPQDGVSIYKSRLCDHYGLGHNVGSEMKGTQWPEIGIRVPYEPMTFDDLRLGTLAGRKRSADDVSGTFDGIIAKDARLRIAHEVRSMAVPIIDEPQQPWGGTHEDLGGGDATGSLPDESDDEDDPFTKSYKEGPKLPDSSDELLFGEDLSYLDEP
ncbi:Nn.00g042930.m01.CDS01 [Neocucurbitaria sp. VM-36]